MSEGSGSWRTAKILVLEADDKARKPPDSRKNHHPPRGSPLRSLPALTSSAADTPQVSCWGRNTAHSWLGVGRVPVRTCTGPDSPPYQQHAMREAARYVDAERRHGQSQSIIHNSSGHNISTSHQPHVLQGDKGSQKAPAHAAG
uniref:Uncharacterized protein n=1 Tax=Sus scrofa TaxID=9823 RepID=A0A480IJ68_PIG